MTTATKSAPTDLAAAAADINAAHRACETATRAAVTHALDAGRLLLAAKAALPHGAWLSWLRGNVSCSERTCQLYMRLAREWSAMAASKSATVAGLGLRELAALLAEPRSGGTDWRHEPDEWYSPPEIVEPARDLLGGFDLDPASCPDAQEVVDAAGYYTSGDDGLAQPWPGRVWCNPPYSLVDAFAAKLIGEYDAGRLIRAVLLTNASTDAAWFADLAARYPVLFTRGRVAFWRPDHPGESPRFGQALFGVGVDAAAFADAFAGLAYAPNAPRGDR